MLLFSLLLLSCTSVRPVIKIGLLAPFEGLHRRSGYMALTAMRQAIAEMAPTVAIMPLALDDAADPAQVERAARKLLQDQDVRALIGPYNPVLAQQIEPLLTARQMDWWLPFAVVPDAGFIVPTQPQEWAEPLLAAAVEKAVALGCQRLVVAGWTPGWPTVMSMQQQTTLTLPVLLNDQVTAVAPTDAVFWVGSPEAGAGYLTDLRATHPNVPLLLGPQADDPIFAELTQISGPVYLLFWVDEGYEEWRQQNAQPPMAYLTYRATQQAVAQLLEQPWPQHQSWRIEIVPVVEGAVP